MDKRLIHQIGKVFCVICFNVSAFAEGEIAYNPQTGVDEQKPYEPQYSRRSNYRKKPNIEINTNFTFSKIDYNVVTAANSVLKWRDSSGFGLDLSLAKVTDYGNKFIASYKNTSLSGGVMSDYDMKNMYPIAGVFSETTKMTGTSKNYSLAYESAHHTANASDISWLLGYEYRTLHFNPSDVYQIAYDSTATNDYGGSQVSYNSGQSQSTKVSMHGVKLGTSYKAKLSDTNNLIFSTEAFIPISFISQQYNWGYGNSSGWDSQMKNIGIAGYGLGGKIQNQVALSSSVWLNLYTFAEITSIASSKMTNRIANISQSNGKTNDIKFYRFGIGTGLTFH